MDNTLTDRRLDYVMDDIRSLLQEESYHDAIVATIEKIVYYLESGPPDPIEEALEWIVPLAFFSVFAGLMGAQWYTAFQQRRAYARVSSQLSELDRTRAEALQGRYRATSCPICLEEFEIDDTDGTPKCGSDHLPLKLLRCGHVFDETCWSQWVTTGRGNVTKCPVCNQDVGAPPTAATNQLHDSQTLPTENNTAASAEGSERQPEETTAQQEGGEEQREEDRLVRIDNNREILQQYQRERRFRLARLGARYPQFVRPHQIQQWSQPNYQGSLVQEKSFVNSNPTRQAASSGGSHYRSGSSNGGFGGGFSGGGRGGRW